MRVCPLQVKLNRGLDFVQLDDLLIDLKLTPDVLEVPVPRYFIEDRAQVRQGGGDRPLASDTQCMQLLHQLSA